MPSDNTEQRFPLTKQQQGLWIEWKLHPDNTSYNTCVKVKLKGEIDVKQMGQALFDIVQYFDSLKVYFREESGIPYQCIKSSGTYFLQFEDISIPSQAETPELAQQGLDFLSKTLNTSIDLKTFPLVRASLMKVAEDTYYFIGMVPHMISDGRSAVLFLESLSIAYNGGYQGLQQAYDSTIKGWSEFHDDKRNQFDAVKHAISKEHWQQRLDGANHYFDYSYGRKNSLKDDKQGHRVYFDIPDELAKGLKAHTSKNKTTLFNVMVCAFGIFIHRYFALKDILVGFPISIRPPGYKHLFGFFVNIVPIRIDLSGDPTYQELLARVSKTRKEDKRHQKFPALDIVNAVRENVDDFDGQLFNLSMAQTVSRLYNLELEGVETQALESEYNDVNDDLSLSYELLEDGIGLWFEYRTSMFDEAFINQGIQHIRQILDQMVNKPETHLSEFNLLSDVQSTELERLSKGVLSRQPDHYDNQRPENNLVSLFEYTAAEYAHDNSLRTSGSTTSYEQLNASANQLAHLLLDKGLQQHQRVAICLKRGATLITSLLAILKSGCSYIPIAPDYPRSRLQFILDDTKCDFIIFENDTAELCKGLANLSVNVQQTKLADYSTLNLELKINNSDTAYIIYTSGSTGQPKGVVISHGNLMPKLQCLQQEISLSPADVMLQTTDYSFDVSVAEIFWPLTSGAALALTEQGQNKYPEQILDIISEQKVTVSCMVPSMLNALLIEAKRTHSQEKLQSLKYMLAAGEVLSPRLINNFQQHYKSRLYNFYGPTEATIYASFYQCEPTFNLPACPIGKPLQYSSAYILDDNLKLVAKGVVGELYLAGPSISTGYLNRKELSEKSFVVNPFSQSSDELMYRTGDKARYLLDGNIDFLGRIDHQVKIRGYRIEMGEIEYELSRIESISDCAVIEDKQSQRLVAYFVEKDESTKINDHEFVHTIKAELAQSLPSYMIPALFLKIESIPRSQSGKIDYGRLPPISDSIIQTQQYTPATTEIEKHLVSIWSCVLKIPENKIGIEDSFFELGGDSLMAIQFASIAEEQGIHIDTIALFESRTIAEISQVIVCKDTQMNKLSYSDNEVVGEYPLTARQYKFFNDQFINSNHWNRSFSFDVIKKVSVRALTKAFTQVLEYHDALRVKFIQKDSGEWVQVDCPTADLGQSVFHLNLIELDADEQQETMRRYIEQGHRGMHLNRAPLIKAVYFELEKDSGSLVIISHHLLLDMVSSRIVFEDFMRCYEYARRGLTHHLSGKTSSLKTWTEYLQQYVIEKDFSEALSYWGNFPINPSPKVPLDFQFNPNTNGESTAKTVIVKSSMELTDKLLKEIPREHGYKIQDLLLAAFFKVTQQWTKDNSLTVNICGHGRNSGVADINLSRTVGWVNTVFPVRLVADKFCDTESLIDETFINNVIQQIAEVPTRNMDYNILRYIKKQPEIVERKSAELFFNYVGQIDAIIPDKIAFRPTEGLQSIAEIDGRNHLCYLLYFEAGVTAGELNIRLTYSKSFFKDETIGQLMDSLVDSIGQIVDTLCPTLVES